MILKNIKPTSVTVLIFITISIVICLSLCGCNANKTSPVMDVSDMASVFIAPESRNEDVSEAASADISLLTEKKTTEQTENHMGTTTEKPASQINNQSETVTIKQEPSGAATNSNSDTLRQNEEAENEKPQMDILPPPSTSPTFADDATYENGLPITIPWNETQIIL